MITKLLQKEEGIALPTVVVIIAIITLLGFTAFFLVSSQTAMGNRYEKSETALSIAEAGINEYLWRLNKDSKFYTTPQGKEFVKKEHAFQNGKYKLEITEPTVESPTLKIKSTAWLNGDEDNKCAVEVEVRKREFVQHIFMSDDEKMMNDEEVWWTTDDEVKGPFHTNGTLYIKGRPIFHDRVTYSKEIQYYSPGSNNPDYRKGRPERVEPLVFPTTNQQLKNLAKYGGYYFEGRTCIMLDGNAIRIRNKNNSVQVITDLKNGVIYVDGNVSDTTSKWNQNLGNVFVSGKLNGRLTIAASNNIYITGYDPTILEWRNRQQTGGITYQDTTFDEKGYVVNDGDDMLGLIAGEYIRILHYGWFDGRTGNVALDNITIHAALFALKRSFEFERYDEGNLLGTVTVVGSICQNRRGAVGTFSRSTGQTLSGYDKKDYTHDRRMAYDTPPHFLEPVNAGWEIVSWKRVAP